MSEAAPFNVRKVLFWSVSRARNVSVLGAGATAMSVLLAAGFPTVSIVVLVLSALCYSALIGTDLMLPEHTAKQLKAHLAEQGDVRALLASPLELIVPVESVEPRELRHLYAEIIFRHDQIRQSLDQCSPMLRETLADSYCRCGDLVQQAGVIAQRGRMLHHYLSRESRESLKEARRRLVEKAARAEDPEAARAYTQAADGKRQQLDTYLQIDAMYDRVQAQLSVISAVLDRIHASVIKLHANDLEEDATAALSMSEQLSTISNDLQALEVSVEEMAA